MASQSIVLKVPPPPAFLVTGEISEEEATVMHAWEGTEWHRLRVGHTKLIRDAAVAFGSEYGRLLVPSVFHGGSHYYDEDPLRV